VYNDVILQYVVITRDVGMQYASIQTRGREALRRAILDAATRLLVEGGLPALSMRRVAAEVGCSTTVLYTLFGGKQGMVEALWREGFDRLWQAEEVVLATDDPLDRLAALGRAYRQHALENPDYYRVMFGGVIPDFQPSEPALDRSRRTFQVLVDAVQGCIEAQVFRAEDPEAIALVLWATVHGVVSLELAGSFREAERQPIFERAMRAVAMGFREGI
jgi:AcrR family transcriptional regulator